MRNFIATILGGALLLLVSATCHAQQSFPAPSGQTIAQAECPKGYVKNSKGNCCRRATTYEGCLTSCAECGGSNCQRFCGDRYKK